MFLNNLRKFIFTTVDANIHYHVLCRMRGKERKKAFPEIRIANRAEHNQSTGLEPLGRYAAGPGFPLGPSNVSPFSERPKFGILSLEIENILLPSHGTVLPRIESGERLPVRSELWSYYQNLPIRKGNSQVKCSTCYYAESWACISFSVTRFVYVCDLHNQSLTTQTHVVLAYRHVGGD